MTNRNTSSSKNNNVPMTPYSYVDRISFNNNISTIKMTRSNSTISKSSYNPNIIDVLTIKQRLEDNSEYDKQHEVFIIIIYKHNHYQHTLSKLI